MSIFPRSKVFWISVFLILLACFSFADDTILGKYYVENAVENYQGTRFFEIIRNEYQEYMVIAENSFQSIAYYDSINHELFCVIEGMHQYNTLMKIKITDDQLTVFSLINEEWYIYPSSYKKETI